MKYLIRLSLKNMKRHLIQSLLTIIGISLSVAIILAVFMVNATMKESVAKTAEELGTGITDIWVQELNEDVATIGTKQEGFSEDLLNNILKEGSIASIHPSIKIYTSTENADNFYLYGVNFSEDREVRNYVLTEGTYPKNEEQILIGEFFAKSMKVKPGSKLTIPSPIGNITFQVSGILSSKEGTGTLNNNNLVFADLKTVQHDFGYEGKVTSFNIILQKNVKTSVIINQLKDNLPPNISIFSDPIMDVSSSDSTEKLRIMAFVFAFISIFIAMFIIYNTLSSSVEQSRKELGLLRLIGMTNKQVRHYFLIQSTAYSMIGSIVGILLGLLLGSGLLYLVSSIVKFQTFFIIMPSYYDILISVGIGIGITVIVGLFPAIKASKVSPMNVFRNSDKAEEKSEKLLSFKNMIGIILMIVGIAISYLPAVSKLLVYIRFIGPVLIFIGVYCLLDTLLPPVLKVLSRIFKSIFGLPGFLAVQGLELRLKRTVTTVGSITVAVSIFIGFIGATNSMKQTVSDWYDNTKWADVLLFSVSGGEINESIRDKIENYEYIDKINPMRYYYIRYENENLSDNGFLFQGVNPESFLTFTERDIIGANPSEILNELKNEPSILINENLSKMLELGVGDSISLKTKNGVVAFKVIGLISDYSDFTHRMGKVVYGSSDTLASMWDAKGYTVIQIKLKDGFTQDFAKEKIMKELSNEYNIKVITHDEEKQDVSAAADQIFSIIYALNIIILIIVFMGIFNTILINVLFQIKEFAILRAIGLLRSQIRKLVICEALAIGIIGTLFATILGLWFSKQMTVGMMGIMGTIVTYYVPITITVLMFFATVILSIVATIYPQKIVSGISISKVIQSVDEM